MSLAGGWYLGLAAALFAIGAVGLLVRRNVLIMFMCIELMLNAANLTFVTFARMLDDIGGQALVFFVLVVAADDASIGFPPVRSMGVARALRHQYLQRVSDEFRGCIAEHRFGLRINQNYGAFGIDHDHAARGCFDDSLHEFAGTLTRHARILRSAAIRSHKGVCSSH